MKTRFLLLFIALATATICAQQLSEKQLREKADRLAHEFIMTDGHVDIPSTNVSEPTGLAYLMLRGTITLPLP